MPWIVGSSFVAHHALARLASHGFSFTASCEIAVGARKGGLRGSEKLGPPSSFRANLHRNREEHRIRELRDERDRRTTRRAGRVVRWRERKRAPSSGQEAFVRELAYHRQALSSY